MKLSEMSARLLQRYTARQLALFAEIDTKLVIHSHAS